MMSKRGSIDSSHYKALLSENRMSASEAAPILPARLPNEAAVISVFISVGHGIPVSLLADFTDVEVARFR